MSQERILGPWCKTFAGGIVLVLALIVVTQIGCGAGDPAGDATAGPQPPGGTKTTSPSSSASAATEVDEQPESHETGSSPPPAASTAGSDHGGPPPALPGQVQVADPPGDSAPEGGRTEFDAVAAGSAESASVLRYQWKEDLFYSYRFTAETEIMDAIESVSGGCLYDVMPAEVARFAVGPMPAEEEEQEQKGTGTAFVVGGDGYLLSCAHVVEDATKLEVHLGNKTYAGQVVAVDRQRDLALLRIPAQNLPALPLSDSDAVELAQDVRAVGFPLSDVLGKSVKITRGTIAGIFTRENAKLFQIDVSINPGNSGGPLVNEKGEVVGVTNAKLVGEDISTVGFAVPANQAKGLLSSHRVRFGTRGAAEKLEGPELARRVSPAVALVSVTIDPGGAGGSQWITLSFHGSTMTDRRSKGEIARGLGTSASDSGQMVVNQYGEVRDFNGSRQLPGLLGPMGLLVIDALSPTGSKAWTTECATSITRQEEEGSSPLGGPLHYSPPSSRRFSPFPARPPMYPGRVGPPWSRPRTPFSRPPSTKMTVYPAMERTDYELAEVSEDTAVIQRRYRLETLKRADQPAFVSMAGEGKTTFDRKRGLPEKMEFRATVTYSTGNLTLKVPLQASYELAEVKDKKKALAESRAKLEAARKKRDAQKTSPTAEDTPAVGRPPGSEAVTAEDQQKQAEAKLDGLLKTLRSSQKDWSTCYRPLSELSRLEPVEARRQEVAEVLDPFLTDLNSSLRSSALRAVAKWGAKRNVPTLLKLLDESGLSDRWGAINAMGAIGDERAAEKLAQLVPSSGDGSTAASALKQMGAVAEDAVIKLLEHDAYQVRREACRILRAIGGQKSVEALEELLKTDDDRVSRSAAQRALDDLRRRLPDTKKSAD